MSILIEKLPTCVLDVGFVIEGREDDEMPEAMLGVTTLSCLELSSLRALG